MSQRERRALAVGMLCAGFALGVLATVGLGALIEPLPAPGPQCIELQWIEVAWVCVPIEEAG